MRSSSERLRSKIKIDAETSCWNWTASKRNGYGLIWIDGHVKSAHRISFEIHVGPIPEGLDVLHRCDNPSCVNPEHLSIGTHAENMNDMVVKGRVSRLCGMANHQAKFSDTDILAIRAAEGGSGLQTRLAEQYGVSKSIISDIRSSKRWGHIKGGA